MVEIRKYDLPDFNIFFRDKKRSEFYTWVPDKKYIVLGNSNKVAENLIEENIISDGIPVYKRPSGGETVILTPGTLVISVKIILDRFMNPRAHFNYFNNKIILALNQLGASDLKCSGISDVSLGDKKILGSSIYRSKNVLFYHAVLNVSEPVETIERYIKHPVKEPDYRQGRSHREFVTSLHAEGYTFSLKQINDNLEDTFSTIHEDEILPLSGE